MMEKKFWKAHKPSDTESAYYAVAELADDGMEALRCMFPNGEASELNLVLFSTSGIHGTYSTIEDVERGGEDAPIEVTFLVIHPRIVCMRYGNAEPKTPEDFAFLKKLRASSHVALASIGSASHAI